MIGLIFLALAAATASDPEVRAAKPAEIEAIRTSLERQLNDAQSARFDSVSVKGENFCGLVNAKNRMGAYVGYRPFQGMIFKADGKLLAASLGVDAPEEVTRKMCAEKGIPLPP